MVFASGREGKKYLGNGEKFNDLYAIKFDNADKMTGGTARKLEPIFNTPKQARGQRHLHARWQNDGVCPLEHGRRKAT